MVWWHKQKIIRPICCTIEIREGGGRAFVLAITGRDQGHKVINTDSHFQDDSFKIITHSHLIFRFELFAKCCRMLPGPFEDSVQHRLLFGVVVIVHVVVVVKRRKGLFHRRSSDGASR